MRSTHFTSAEGAAACLLLALCLVRCREGAGVSECCWDAVISFAREDSPLGARPPVVPCVICGWGG